MPTIIFKGAHSDPMWVNESDGFAARDAHMSRRTIMLSGGTSINGNDINRVVFDQPNHANDSFEAENAKAIAERRRRLSLPPTARAECLTGLFKMLWSSSVGNYNVPAEFVESCKLRAAEFFKTNPDRVVVGPADLGGLLPKIVAVGNVDNMKSKLRVIALGIIERALAYDIKMANTVVEGVSFSQEEIGLEQW